MFGIAEGFALMAFADPTVFDAGQGAVVIGGSAKGGVALFIGAVVEDR